MTAVVFVAPFFLETTLRFVDATTRLDGVRVGLVSQDPEEALPPGLRSRLAGHYRVADGLDTGQLTQAARALGHHLGGLDRILAPLEQLQVQLAEVRETLGITGMDRESALSFRDKGRMKDVLRAAGVPCAAHVRATSVDEVETFVGAVGLPVVVKPPAGAGAIDTFRVDSPDQLADWLRSWPPSPQAPAQVEEFVTGEEHSFDSVSIGGRVVWHSISRYLPAPLEVLRNPWIQWAVLLPREIDGGEFQPIRDVAPAALRALGLVNGMTHMEWFRRPDGSVAVSEVAARPPGAQITTLLSYAHELDFYEAWARLMVFDHFDPPTRRWAVGAAYLRGQGRGERIVAVHGLDEAQGDVGGLVVEARLPEPGQGRSSSYEGDGYVIVRHEDTAVVADALRRVLETVRVELG